MKIELHPKTALLVLTGIIGVLVAAHLTGLVFLHGFGHDWVFGLVPLFDLDRESNVPTFFSTMLILGNAVLLFALSRLDPPNSKHWKALGAIVVVLAMDELVGFHERIAVARGAGNEEAVLQYLWIAPYAVLTLLVAAAFLPFLRRLPRQTARLILIAGAVYVSGAAGLEIMSGWVSTFVGEEALPYKLVITGEETVEMLGMSAFAYALLTHGERAQAERALAQGVPA